MSLRLSKWLVSINLALALSSCAGPAPAAGPNTLGEIVKFGVTGSTPKAGDYYVEVDAAPNLGASIPQNTCVDRSFWSFARKWLLGTTTSAAAMLTAKITPSGNPEQAITIPVFLTSANELDRSSNGANCQTQFWARAITFTFNSNLNPAFDVDMEFHLTNAATSLAVTNVLQMATNLMTAVGTASGTPGKLATTLADPVIKSLSTQIDTELSNHWTNSNDLKINTTLDSGADGSTVMDRINFKMPPINATARGVSVANSWDAGGTIFLRYTGEKFKSGGRWIGTDDVLVKPIVPLTTPGAETTLYKIVLNGDAAGGFKLANLNSATTEASLTTACQNLRFFLASFLVPSDALVARYAVLKGSPYDMQPSLRAGSGCFDPDDDQKLLLFRNDYKFSSRARLSPNPRSPASLMAPILIALLSENPALIATIVTSPTSSFYLVLGKNASDYVRGADAISRLSQSQLKLTCYQARPAGDLSSIAALATYNGATTGSLVSFDAHEKLASIVLISPEDLATSTGIRTSDWLAPANKWADSKAPQCKAG